MNPPELSRRKFLQLSGLGAFGVSVSGPLTAIAVWQHELPAKMSVQLYTIRDQIHTDIHESLKRLHDIGFRYVETAFWPEGLTVREAAKIIHDRGLRVSSAHIALPEGDAKKSMLDIAAAYQCKKLIWHGWPQDKRYQSYEGTKELAGIYNEAGRFAKANGLQFGLHNHWWEYRNKINGKFVYEILLDLLDPDIFFEVDTYWVKVAGQDPAKIIQRLGKRAPMLHIKDGPAIYHDSLAEDNPDPMTAVGKGTQNFPAIVKAANGNTEWMVVEMDKTVGDPFDALKESFEYLLFHKMARVS